jgi:hypothetical protein
VCGAVSTGIDGDTTSLRTTSFNPIVLGGELQQILFRGHSYDDEFIRTAEGGRMRRRVESKCFNKVV